MSDAGKAVFLSYASQDAETAKRIAEALRAAGIEVWFDQNELRGGDVWDRKIRQQIKECALFVPIISANTQARTEGYFRLEWRQADQRTHLMGRNRAFLVPVCIDDTSESEADVPDSFMEVQWTRLHQGYGGRARPEGADPAMAVEKFSARVKALLAGGGGRDSRVGAGRSGSGGRVGSGPLRQGSEGQGGSALPGGSAPQIADYELLRLIGSGSYGDVWLARGMTGIHRAVKVVWRDRFENDEPFERELRGLKEFAAVSLKTEGQMALLHIGRNEAAGFFYYVMELADDANTGRTFDPATYVPLTLKEWKQRKGRVPAADVIAAGAELATALGALHALGLVHRDIKPSNVILVNGKARLADIGLVTAAHDARTFIGTSGYVPPEGPGAPAADVFALGRVLYELATGLDREEFPKLPPGLDQLKDRAALFELNEVLLRACAPADRGRYREAGELAADLIALRDGQSLRGRRGRRAVRWLAAAVVFAAGLAAWRWLAPGPTGAVRPGPAIAAIADDYSIAVLPFENRSDDKANSYLADGVHEDVVTNLASLPRLKVVSRVSAMRYRGTDKSMRQVGEELGVAFILTGSVRREANRVRVATQLVDARTELQVWARNFDREMTDVLALQTDLAGAIVPALHLVLSPEEKSRLTHGAATNAAAYDRYLRARALREGGRYEQKSAAEAAEVLLRQAVAEDPGFVRAWVELSAVHADRYFFLADDRTAVRVAQAESAIGEARRLAPDDPEVLVGLGRIRYACFGDYPGAMHYYQRVLAGHPNYPDIHVPLGLLYRRLGRWAEAIDEFKQGWKQEPGNVQTGRMLAATLVWVRQFDAAATIFKELSRFNPNDLESFWLDAVVGYRRHGSQSEFKRTQAAMPVALRESPRNVGRLINWASLTGERALLLELVERHGVTLDHINAMYFLMHHGDRAKAMAWLTDLKREIDRRMAIDPAQATVWTDRAKYHALIGERSAAIEAMDRARGLMPEDSDAMNGVGVSWNRAMVLAWLGDHDEALAEIERLLRLPGNLHFWSLRRSLDWLPLLDHPRFKALLDDPANQEPLYGEGSAQFVRPRAPTGPAPRAAAVAPAIAIGVLPFAIQGDDKENDYFADGLHEDLLTRLSGIAELKVISRTTMLRYRATRKSPGEIGRELGVGFLLEGSIRKAANQVRVTARLVDTVADRQVWAQSYDRELTDVFALQSALAKDIAGRLPLKLSPAERSGLERTLTTNEPAYDLYLRARQKRAAAVFSRENLIQAEDLLRKALVLDPGFVPAWAELAMVHSVLYFQIPTDRTPARLAQAEEAVAEARRLAPEAPEVLLAQGLVRYYGYRDYTGALYYLQKLAAAHPNFPEAYQTMGRIHRRQGRWTEAQAAFRKVWELDPGNRGAASEFNFVSVFLRRYAEVDAVLRQMQVFWPDDQELKFMVAVAAYRRSGSKREFEHWRASIPADQLSLPDVVEGLLNWSLWRGDEAMLLDAVRRHGIPEDNLEFAAHLIHTEHRPKVLELLERQKARQERNIAADPLSGRTWAKLAQIHALRGERAAALDAITRSRQLLPESLDALSGVGNSIDLALAQLWLGDKDAALAEVERLVKVPGGLHAWVLRDSLVWRPVRADPRIEAILNDPVNFLPVKVDDQPVTGNPADGGYVPRKDTGSDVPRFSVPMMPTGAPGKPVAPPGPKG